MHSNSVTLTDDYSRDKVPEEYTYSGLHIALVIVGGTIGIPMFLMAAQIGSSLGLARAVPAFFAGSLILGTMGALTSYAGARTRLSTYILTEFAFGRQGAKIVNLVIALSLVGWYGVIANVFAQAADMVMRDSLSVHLPIWSYAVVGSLLMVAVTLSGFDGIDKLALLLVPAMLFFLAYAAWITWDGGVGSAQTGGDMSFSQAVSAVIGCYIAGVVIQPDYSRFARNRRHAVYAAFIALGVSFPVLQMLAAVPSVATGEQDLIKIMVMIGIGLPAFLLLLLSSWSSNVLCLYSSGLSFSTVFTRTHLKTLLILIGVIGTALALVHAQSYLISFLMILGIGIPPIAAIYVMDVLVIRKGCCEPETLSQEPAIGMTAFFSWGIGLAVGVAASNDIATVTGIAALDTVVSASVIYLVFNANRITSSWKTDVVK